MGSGSDAKPYLEWYLSRSREAGLPPRCPFASVGSCPRYFQSLSLLAEAGFTALDAGRERKLLRRWKKSDLWPVTDEQATAVYNSGESFSGFCPEVSHEAFGLFAVYLSRHADELDRDLAHKRLAAEGVDGNDWRWRWQSVIPMHYSECPLFSPLAVRLASSEEGRTAAKEVWQVQPNLYGVGLDVRALWSRIKAKWGSA